MGFILIYSVQFTPGCTGFRCVSLYRWMEVLGDEVWQVRLVSWIWSTPSDMVLHKVAWVPAS